MWRSAALLLLATSTVAFHLGGATVARSIHSSLDWHASDSRLPPSLTGSQKRALRAHAGRLAAAKALRYVNVAEVTRSCTEVDEQLECVELVRCKFAVAKKKEAKEMADELALATGAAVAEVLGHTALLYRASAKGLIDITSS